MKDFSTWFNETTERILATEHVERVLTPEAQMEREDFEAIGYADQGCICFTGCAPCSWCTHPGNPRNQDEDESCWTEVSQ